MIGLLRGQIVRQAQDHVILECQGVGYVVFCDQRTLAELSGGGVVELEIETQVREDSITLFGFLREDEKAWFKRLQAIQGVGARSALSLLSVLSADQLISAIMAQDKAPLTKAAGVGPKLAGRIVSELKDRMPKMMASSPAPAGIKQAPGPADALDDAVAALVQLGYGRSEAYSAVHRLKSSHESVEDLIRQGLKELAK